MSSIKYTKLAKKLYVGNLPYSTTQDDLQNMFAAAGTVESASVISDKFTGNSKGFGFVEMATDADAQKAIEMFNGKDIGGREMKVNEARPIGDRPPRHGRGADNE